jgi:hypothetical protein
MATRKKYKPRKRYSRSMVVDFFSAMHGNKQPCVDGECPIVTAMDGRVSIAEATTLDPDLTRAIDRYTRKATGQSTTWEKLTAAEIVTITREVMRDAA